MTPTKSPGTWTCEYLYSLPDEKRYELIDGELYEMPPPNRKHQTLSIRLIERMLPEVRRLSGELYHAPTGVFLPSNTMLEPGRLVLLPGRRGQESERGIEGAPDLVVEILSPSSAGRDRVEKRRLYAEAGVPEYWIVDPDSASVEALGMQGEGYTTRVLARRDRSITSMVLPGLRFESDDIFAN